MSKQRFIGILLVTTGILFIIVGVTVTLLNQNSLKKAQLANPKSGQSDTSQPSSFVVNLPAPGSIVASPLLIRGKVYGLQDKLLVQLTTSDGQVLVDTATFVNRAESEAPGVGLFQTSLVFAKPEANTGILHFKLVSDHDQIIKEDQIPLTFRR